MIKYDNENDNNLAASVTRVVKQAEELNELVRHYVDKQL